MAKTVSSDELARIHGGSPGYGRKASSLVQVPIGSIDYQRGFRWATPDYPSKLR